MCKWGILIVDNDKLTTVLAMVTHIYKDTLHKWKLLTFSLLVLYLLTLAAFVFTLNSLSHVQKVAFSIPAIPITATMAHRMALYKQLEGKEGRYVC